MPDTTAIITPRTSATPRADDPGRHAGPPRLPEAVEQAVALIDALAVAWTTFRVYADPRPQEAFRRAVAFLGAASTSPWLVEVHSGGFRSGGHPLPTRREAAPALARLAFARGIAALAFASPPSADDLVRLFEVLAAEPDPAGDEPGPALALAQSGVTSIEVVEHARLTEVPEGLAPGDEGTTSAPEDGPPQGATEEGPDPAGRYLDEYRLLYDRLQAGDFYGLQDLVHGFADSFFVLPREQQTRLFEQFLTHRQEAPFRLLLDQFSDGELGELAQLLAPDAHPLLVDYARIAATEQGQSGPALELLTPEQLVTDRISRILRPENAGLRRRVAESLKAQVPGPEENWRAGLGAAGALLALVEDAAFPRLARMLAGKVAAALAAGDLARAGGWIEVLLAHSPGGERKATVRREIERALRSEVLDRLVGALAHEPDGPPPEVVNLVAFFCLDPVLELLAREANKVRRRALIALLAAAAKVRPEPLVRRLGDPRGYLVRHLVDVLGHCGRPDLAPRLRPACSYPDHRVRSAALRSLSALDRGQAADAALTALDDPHPAVRLQALSTLRGDDDPRVDLALSGFLAGRPSPEEQVAAVAVLAARRSEEGRALLRRVARRRLWYAGAAREAREAARRLLARGAR